MRPGTKLASYEILGTLGAGGMGEVYRARDTKLGREVAVKVLPEALAGDGERARFAREAKLLAALNHPGIATLYGVDEDSGRLFLVMELVEGETLSERIARGPLDWEEAKGLFVQMAEALEAAHGKGVLHRDLKPANVKITPEGRIKLLDFGLAKALENESPIPEASQSPTLTKGTALGAILGTASYMSPEQARGKALDRRTDIWAFGCCLFEALTGTKAFEGETVTDTLAAVVKSDPDFSRLPFETPTAVERALRRCLTKDPARRLRDAGDLSLELEESDARDGSAAVNTSSARWTTSQVVLLLAGGILAGLAGSLLLRPLPKGENRRLEITFPPDAALADGKDLALSPDGRRLAYAGTNDERKVQLFVRDLDRLEPRAIPGTEGAQMPAFSPDGSQIAFYAPKDERPIVGRIQRVGIEGGTPLDVCPAYAANWAGIVWGPDDTIVFSQAPRGLARVAAGGGEPEVLTHVDTGSGEKYHIHPQFLPDGESVLFTVVFGDDSTASDVLSLKSKERTRLEGVAGFARSVESGHWIYPKGSNVLVSRSDAQGRRLAGPETPLGFAVARGVESYGETIPHLDWARDGTLLYVPPNGVPRRDFAVGWYREDGSEERLELKVTGEVPFPSLSPDGKRLAVTAGRFGVWVHDLESGSPPRRLTFGEDRRFPIWSPDGRRVAFSELASGAIHLMSIAADGSEVEPSRIASFARELLPAPVVASSWTPEGSEILASDSESIWVTPVDGSSPPRRLFDSPFRELLPSLSPDGDLIAYQSNRSGSLEVWLSPYPDVGRKPPVQVSRNGGSQPRWSRDGGRLFYLEGRRLMAASVVPGDELRVEPPRALFTLPGTPADYPLLSYDVAPDGRILVVQREARTERSRVVLVENWFEELERLVPRN